MNDSRPTTSLRGGLFVAGVFFLIAIVLGGALPLWLDEITQLRETRNTAPSQLFASLPLQPGAAPLGYLIQQTMLRVTGYSVRWARFPSALFVAATVLVVALIGAELGLSNPWIGAVLFAAFPITLRYACESRVYSQALLFSSLAILLFIRLVKNPGWRETLVYSLTLTAAIYTQPYAVFVGAANIVWVVFRGDWRGDRRTTVLSTAAFLVAIAVFLPWYFWTKAEWSAGLAGVGIHFVFSPKTPLMLFREISGAGYWGSAILMILSIAAVIRRGRNSGNVLLLVLLIVVPTVLALAADAFFGYFVATRQILWILPAIAVLSAFGIQLHPRRALPAVALLTTIFFWQSFRNFTGTRENWGLAADALSSETGQGACLVVVPAEQKKTYLFFRPELAQSSCPAPRTVVAFTPYATGVQRDAAVAALVTQGYRQQYVTEKGKSGVSLFVR